MKGFEVLLTMPASKSYALNDSGDGELCSEFNLLCSQVINLPEAWSLNVLLPRIYMGCDWSRDDELLKPAAWR